MVYPRIIGEIPCHTVYVEGFAGGAGVYRNKARAEISILIDKDPVVCEAWRNAPAASRPEAIEPGCFLDLVARPGSLREAIAAEATFVYLDPPYLDEEIANVGFVQNQPPNRYAKPFGSLLEHRDLLRWCAQAKCRVMISGYWSSLYESMLAKWRCIRFPAMTRGGLREEVIWMNYPAGLPLHDPRFAGGNFRERERIKRRAESWASMYKAMGSGERSRVLAAVLAVERETSG